MKVMLAEKTKLDLIKFPVWMSPKIDGIRCHIGVDDKGKPIALTRTNKPIPNMYIQKSLSQQELIGCDGEITVGSMTDRMLFRNTTSGVMSFMGKPDFHYNIFDNTALGYNIEFESRYLHIQELFDTYKDAPWMKYCTFVKEYFAKTIAEVSAFEDKCLNEGYEGVILRAVHSPYKEGRSTLKQGYLLKLKRFVDAEAKVIGFEELMHNDNELGQDELGYAKRSSSKDGLVPAGMLGSLVVSMDIDLPNDTKQTVTFNIGSGFDEATRREIWNHKEKYLGKYAKFKYFDNGGYGVPRFPIFLGWRDERDM